jgi:hypothetical protein
MTDLLLTGVALGVGSAIGRAVAAIAVRTQAERDLRSPPPTWPVFAGEILIRSAP